MPEKYSTASAVIEPGDLARVVSDLGNRASDLVQSNFVIWVEGPSDRLYIRKWLSLHDSELVENGHYSIMFYGGALLSHLTVEDDAEVDDFIHLLRLNRNAAVVIDSDRSDEGDDLNSTKRRVLDELAKIKAPAWVTDGYTIENYIPREVMQQTIAAVYPSREYTVPKSKFRSPLGSKFRGSEAKPSKTTIARAVIDQLNSPKDLPADLLPHLKEVAAAIRRANGLGIVQTDEGA
jgi:hypothetical protein